MTRRREFLASLGAFAAAGSQGWTPAWRPGSASVLTPAAGDREYWLDVLTRLTEPVLTNLAEGRLRQRMPVEIAPAGRPERRDYTHLEAVGRLLTGIAPWLELPDDGSPDWPGRLPLPDSPPPDGLAGCVEPPLFPPD